MRYKPKLVVRLFRRRISQLKGRNFILMLAMVIGISGGVIALILKTSVYYMRSVLLSETEFDYRNYLLLIYPAIGVVLTVMMKRFVIKDNVKHNIASILYAISKRKSIMRTHKIFSSMMGGILTAGFGGSIGLEAPIISSGSALGSNIGKFINADYKTITLLLACGATGAMSAIFNTPVAAVVFAFEVLLIDLSRFSLIPLLLSSVSGTIVTSLFYEDAILFDFTITHKFDIKDLPYYGVFAVVSGFLAIYFTRIYLFVEKKFEKINKPYKKIFIGTSILGVLIFLFPPFFGEGFQSIKILLSGNYMQLLDTSIFRHIAHNDAVVFAFFTALVLLKVFATVLTASAGGVGGIFAPSLFSGAFAGFLFVTVINYTEITHLNHANFILIGMASMLAGVLHAPLTSMFLIAEITSGYHLFVPLMFTVTITYITVKYFEPNSIFTIHLAQRGELITHNKDKAVLTFMKLNDLIETDFIPVNINGNLGDLIKAVAKSHRNIFPVVDDQMHLEGIVTLDSIREIMFNPDLYNKIQIKNLLEHPPEIIKHTDAMNVVMRKFNETQAWNLPVTKDGKYLGFVSKSKMFSVYRQLLVNITED